jgi:hypothetical protein
MNLYLLIESEVVGEETDGVINNQLIEVSLGEEVVEVSLEDINEVNGVRDGIEALSEGLVVVLKRDGKTEGEGLP